MKILAKVPLSPYVGYGRDGLGMAQALIRAGHDLSVMPINVQPPIPQVVANLFTKTAHAPFDLGIVHLDPNMIQLAPDDEMRRSCKTLIGWTMWEYTDLSNLKGHSKFRKAYKDYDALVAYDPVTAEALREHYSGPIILQMGGFDPTGFEYHDRNWNSREFFFGMIGMLSNRKNPFAAINAFAQLKHEHPKEFEPARLILKTSSTGLHPGVEDLAPGLRVIYDVWSNEQVKDFYRRIHVLLAPSRGEGKNLPCLEAMSTGAGVVATNWGGHTVWMDPDIAYPLDYKLIRSDIYKSGAMWADADVDHLKSYMLRTIRNRTAVAEKGKRAAARIPAEFNWDITMQRLLQKVGAL